MLSIDQANYYWEYCLSIEKNLERTTDFVEVCSHNETTYSFEYVKIIMLACSEIDVLCRLLCKEIDPTSDYDDSSTRTGDISKYATIILNRFPKIITVEIYDEKKRCSIIPFKNWTIHSAPTWWKEYQKVKHYRHSEYKYATQYNAFYSVAGLIILNLYLYRLLANQPYANPYPHPHLFNSDIFSPFLLTCSEKELPDFQ